MSIMQSLVGLCAGLIFGLGFYWGWFGAWVTLIGVSLILIGSILPTNWRWLFGSALLGFLVSFIVGSGVSLL